MIVGILSDTHGRADMAAAAVELLLRHGAESFVHCGDVGSLAVLDALAGQRATFVFGNNDWDRAEMEAYAADLGLACGGTEGKLALGTKLGVVTHGDDGSVVRRVLQAQRVDYLFVGHSHVVSDERVGRVRVINPGALYRAARKTVAVLDTETDQLAVLTVELPGG